MSENCIHCIVNKRTGGDLLCDECRAKCKSPESTCLTDLENRIPQDVLDVLPTPQEDWDSIEKYRKEHGGQLPPRSSNLSNRVTTERSA